MWMIPRVRATLTAAVRSWTSSLSKMLLTWVCTVSSLIAPTSRNLPVPKAPADLLQDLDFPGRERRPGRTACQLRPDAWTHWRLTAVVDLAHCLDEIRKGGVLDHICSGARSQRPGDVPHRLGTS